ncbi:MAG: tetratricopeptide repeat protein, partial [Candidatus Krumholzibacteria bacterium]|nr:tetratricopeptide repeat protein [Candidatus Krumholzibacteria bacterium]
RFHEGDLETAFEHFSVAVKENPTYPDLYYRMGVIHHQRGELDESLEMLGRAIGLNESYFEAVCFLGIVLHEKGRIEDADTVFKRALELGADNPGPISKFLSDHIAGRSTEIPPLARLREIMYTDTDFDSLMREGVESYNTGHYERAIELFNEAAGLHPDYADVRFKLGLSMLRHGNHEEARAQLLESLRINDHYTEARFYLGVSYLDEKLYREALPHFKRAVLEKPGYADLQCYLGSTYFYLGELKKARAVLDQALELSPGYPKARYYYGLLLYALGEKKDAVEYLSGGIPEIERPGAANINLALVYLKEGNLEEAMVVLKEVLAAGGESADVLYFLGEVYMRMSRFDEAEELFGRALDINPSFLRAREKLAVLLVRREDYKGAEEILGNNGDDFADVFKIMGDIKYFRGELDAAEVLYRKSLDINSEYSEAVISLALTLRKKGREEEAEKLLEKLLEIEPENVLARNLVGRGPLDLES